MQKVSIARTIVHDPPVLIFDEPTSGLDVLVAREVLKKIELLRDQGKCIIFSTHIMREVEKLLSADRRDSQRPHPRQGTLAELADRYNPARCRGTLSSNSFSSTRSHWFPTRPPQSE